MCTASSGSASGPVSASDPKTTAAALLALLLLLTVGGPARSEEGASVSAQREAAYNEAVEASSSGDHGSAAREAWRYVDGASRDDPRFDRALRMLALAGEGIGLTYAASLWWLDIADSKREPELVPIAMRGLERIVMTSPHDHETLVAGFLASAELPVLGPDLQPFVDYQQGLDSLRHGLDDWSARRFERIPGDLDPGPYRHRADYVLAIRLIDHGRLADASEQLDALAEREGLPEDLAAQLTRSRARLRFEVAEYAAALELYETIRHLAPEDPAILLEMAWTHFYLGNSRRAIGLLIALDAPVYGDLIAPERFLLEALALRRLCQFEPARTAARRLQARHGSALADVHEGKRLLTSEPLRAAARRRGETQRRAQFRARLQRELEIIQEEAGSLGPKLVLALGEMYGRGLAEAQRREEQSLADAVEAVAEDLLHAEEGVQLVLHELSVGILRGRRRPEGPSEVPPSVIQAGGSNIVYDFSGEFWTDELDDLVAVLDDRCLEE